MTADMESKAVITTGTSSDLGDAAARDLADPRASVIATARRLPPIDQFAVATDVTRSDHRQWLADSTIES